MLKTIIAEHYIDVFSLNQAAQLQRFDLDLRRLGIRSSPRSRKASSPASATSESLVDAKRIAGGLTTITATDNSRLESPRLQFLRETD